jgi:hypothetical protein
MALERARVSEPLWMQATQKTEPSYLVRHPWDGGQGAGKKRKFSKEEEL